MARALQAPYSCWQARQSSVDATSSDNFSYWGGGAIRQGEGAALQVDSCTFEANRTDQRGAAIQCGGSESIIVNSTFSGNMTKLRQGGAVLASGLDTRIDHCTFTGNRGSAITMLHSTGQPVLPRPKLTAQQ